MNIKNLEKATKNLEAIKKLDAEIINIGRLAQLVADGNAVSVLDLKITDNAKLKEKENKLAFDEDGFIAKSNPRPMPHPLGGYMFEVPTDHPFGSILRGITGMPSAPKENSEFTHTLKQDLTDYDTLNILGVLLHKKQADRGALIAELKEYGIEIN